MFLNSNLNKNLQQLSYLFSNSKVLFALNSYLLRYLLIFILKPHNLTITPKGLTHPKQLPFRSLNLVKVECKTLNYQHRARYVRFLSTLRFRNLMGKQTLLPLRFNGQIGEQMGPYRTRKSKRFQQVCSHTKTDIFYITIWKSISLNH